MVEGFSRCREENNGWFHAFFVDSGKGGAILFKVVWDKETGGVKLQNKVTSDTLGVSPRPVFYEELDLLKMSNYGWQYPTCQEPLLWACNKQYFYRGELVFEVKGANIYDAPTVILQPQAQNLELIPVDVAKMLEECNSEMFLAESEAIEFIRDVYVQYADAKKLVESIPSNQLDYEALVAKIEKETKQRMAIVKQDCDSFDIMPLDVAKEKGKRNYQTTKIDIFLASFSGGKDSQVVLDLCTRAIPPTAFQVVYSDTGYELPTSLELYEEVKRHYGKIVPDLKFSTARNHESVLNYWDKIGTPSDTHRWCCSIMKTAPLYRMLKIEGTNKQARVLTFDGVRAEESLRRSDYERIGKAVKHNTAINARPILNWSTTEIFLYLFKYELPINKAYRQGHARVGCIICPYSTSWDDMICNSLNKKELEPFLSRIEKSAKNGGIKDVANYVKERKWKLRASGNYMDSIQSSIAFESISPDLIARIDGAQQSIETWLPTIGAYTLNKSKEQYQGQLRFGNDVYDFNVTFTKNNNLTFKLFKAYDANLIKLIRRVLYKTTYCINCEVCEVECPTGALSVYPNVFIDNNKCVHCHKCLNFHDNGCMVANSLALTTNNNMKAKSGIDRYNTFGLKEEWLDLFFADPDAYWNNHGLGTKQVPAMKNWLKDAEIIDAKNNLTELGKCLASIYVDQPQLVWEILWINLVHNSFITKWLAVATTKNRLFSKSLLKEMIQQEFPNVYSERTVKNAIDAAINTLKNTPIGVDFGQLEEVDKENYKRNSYEGLSMEALAYSIYKYSELLNTKMLRVSDFYDLNSENGFFVEFGIGKSAVEKILRTLNSQTNRILVAELNMGLDHITLRDDLNSLQVLELLTK